MRRRNNNKLCIAMVLGATAIFLANCHNVNASEISSFTPNRVRAIKLSQNKKSRPALKLPSVNLNQAADLALNLKQLVVVSK